MENTIVSTLEILHKGFEMTNILESIKDLFSPLLENEEKSPLHIGEVMNFWLLLTLIQEGLDVYQLGLNTTQDDQLIHALKNGEQSSRNVIAQLQAFLKKEGVTLPPASVDKPKSDPKSIPLGVKQTDEQIANLVSAKIAAEITLIGQALAVSVRGDVCRILLHIQFEVFKYGSSFKVMMMERGWLKMPPYYYPPGAPNK